MIPFKTGVIQVTATTTATSLRNLINTAKGSAVDYTKLPGDIDHIEICPEGAITFTIDGSLPTATTGLQGSSTSGILVYEGVSLDQMFLYGSSVKVDVQIGMQGKM